MLLEEDKKRVSKTKDGRSVVCFGVHGRWCQVFAKVSSCCCSSAAPVAHYGRRYAFPSFRLYKGSMLRADDAHRKSELQILEHRGGLHSYGPTWNHYRSSAPVMRKTRNLRGYPWLGWNVSPEWEKSQKHLQIHTVNTILFFPSCCQSTWYILLVLSSEPGTMLFVEPTQVASCIASQQRGMVQQLSLDRMNTEGSDIKSDPTNTCTNNTRDCSWQQFKGYHVQIQKGLNSRRYLQFNQATEMYALLEQQDQRIVTLPVWQNMCCSSRRLSVQN